MIKSLLKFVSLSVAWIGTFFAPVQISHGENMCCAERMMMKREDEIEVVDEEETKTEA